MVFFNATATARMTTTGAFDDGSTIATATSSNTTSSFLKMFGNTSLMNASQRQSQDQAQHCRQQQHFESAKQRLDASMEVVLNTVRPFIPVSAHKALLLQHQSPNTSTRTVLDICQRYLLCGGQGDFGVLHKAILLPAWQDLCRYQYWCVRKAVLALRRCQKKSSGVVAAAQTAYQEEAEELVACEQCLYRAQKRRVRKQRAKSAPASLL